MPPKTPPAKAANNGRPPTDRSPDPAAAITNNYMKLPNDVVDDLMRSSSPIQFKVLMVALRQTIGYNRNVARIPVRKVEEIANIRRGAALEALRFWQGAGLITRTDARESGRSAVYSLNLIELQDGEVGANAQLLNSDNRFGRPVCQAYRFDRETALVPMETDFDQIRQNMSQHSGASASWGMRTRFLSFNPVVMMCLPKLVR